MLMQNPVKMRTESEGHGLVPGYYAEGRVGDRVMTEGRLVGCLDAVVPPWWYRRVSYECPRVD